MPTATEVALYTQAYCLRTNSHRKYLFLAPVKINLMPRKAVDVTDTELAILEVLWERGSTTIRDVAAELYTETTTTEYGTVQSLLERLEVKGFVKRNRKAFAHTFAAKLERGDLIGQRLQDLAEKLCGGSWTPLLVHLSERTELTPVDRKMLRNIIDNSK